jgi:hypothetical protein
VRDPREILDEFASYLDKEGLNAADLTGGLQEIRG